MKCNKPKADCSARAGKECMRIDKKCPKKGVKTK